MPADPNATRTQNPDDPLTDTFDAGLAAAFGPDLTPGGWSQPPLLRDEPSDHSPVVRPSSPEVPRADGERYQLFGEIARGGMGVVLKGRDPDLGRDLAFKVLKTELAGRPDAIQRFVEEAQVGGQLQHPGVVPVYEIGRFADGRPYFSMKLVKGHTLAELLAARPEPAAERGRFVRHFLQVCQTVAYAHSKGVIHRDLKPANIMVGAFDEVLVMDWGLAKLLPRGGVTDEERASRERERPEDGTEIRTARAGSGSDTAAGSVMGTPAFMSPEQAGGETDKLDERADVFGLGAVLCVVLTGKPPYVAADTEAVRLMAVRGQLAEGFARLDACGADAELVALCKRCLSPERDARPRDAREVADAIAAYLAGVEDRAKRAELERAAAEAEAREQRKRRRVQLALATAVGLLLFGAGSFAWWQDKQAARRAFEAANQERDEQDRRERNANALAELANRCEAALRAGTAEAAATALAEIDRRLPDGSGDGIAARVSRCRADLTLLRDLDAVDQFRWTPVEQRLHVLVVGVDGAAARDAVKGGSSTAGGAASGVVSMLPTPDLVARRWRGAFAAAGLDLGASPTAVARLAAESALRDRLIGSLDVWLVAAPSGEVREVLQVVDPDAYRDALRDAIALRDGIRVAELAERPEALAQPPGVAAALGQHKAVPVARRRAILEVALRTHPGTTSLLMALGETYLTDQKDGADERIRWFQAAVTAEPHSATTRMNLAAALRDKGDVTGAVAALRDAIRLDPTNSKAHMAMGNTLTDVGDLDGAVAAFREAIRLDPKNASPHNHLGNVLHRKGDLDGAVACFREAVRLDPTDARAHVNLGASLARKRDSGATAAYREAIRLDPKYAPAHNNLGAVLVENGDVEGAAAAFHEAVRLDPRNALAHCNLGVILRRQGKSVEAVAMLRRGHELGSRQKGWPYPSDKWVAECEREMDLKGLIAPMPREVRR